MTKPKRKGRPPFKPTPALRRKVSILRAGGMTQEAVAMAIGVDDDTLKKHFEVELTFGAAKARAEIVSKLHEAAKGGNVTAQKAFLARNEGLDVSEDLRPQTAAKEPKLGKKEVAAQEAELAGAGSPWGDDLVLPKS